MLFSEFLNEKRPEWQDSDFPDAEGRFAELSPKDLAAWLIKTRKKDLKAISGSLTQQVVFNRNEDPEYADKMEKTRKEVYKQLGREDLLKKMDESVEPINEIGDASAKPFKWKADQNIKKEIKNLYDRVQKLEPYKSEEVEYTYSFKNDDNVEYIVNFKGWWQRQTTVNLSGKPINPTALYDCSFNLGYNTTKDYNAGVETETNLGDVFRIMATVTEITFDFLKQAESTGYPIKNLTITAKGDEGTTNGMDSRRGRLYLNYIKKQLNKAGTENPYTAFAATFGGGVSGIEIRLGAWRGGSAIKTETKQTEMKHIKLFEQYITEATDSDYEMIVDLILKAKPKYNVYYNSDWNVVNIGGTGYDNGELVKQFSAEPGTSSDIKAAFYRAAQSPEETKKAVEKLSKGKIEVEISKSLVIYKIK